MGVIYPSNTIHPSSFEPNQIQGKCSWSLQYMPIWDLTMDDYDICDQIWLGVECQPSNDTKA